jgi:hypothetical protein
VIVTAPITLRHGADHPTLTTDDRPHQCASVRLHWLGHGAVSVVPRRVPHGKRDLLAAYLDRRHPRWREDAQGDAATGSGPARSGKMIKEEAYQILGAQDRGAIDSGCLHPGEKGIGHVHSSAQSCTQECRAVVKDPLRGRGPPGCSADQCPNSRGSRP